MLKFFFWSLLCLNAALFAYSQGYLGSYRGNEHEPARMKNQLNADKLVIVSAAKANAAAEEAAAAAKASTTPSPLACIEIGNFALADGKRFEAQVAALALGDHQSRHNVATTEATSHIVYIPPQGNKEGAEKKAGELRQLGVTNYFIMSETTSMKWGISLGVFKTEAAAQTLLAALNKQGVHSARIAARGANVNRLAYQFTNIDTDIKAKLEQIKAAYPAQDIHACK